MGLSNVDPVMLILWALAIAVSVAIVGAVLFVGAAAVVAVRRSMRKAPHAPGEGERIL